MRHVAPDATDFPVPSHMCARTCEGEQRNLEQPAHPARHDLMWPCPPHVCRQLLAAAIADLRERVARLEAKDATGSGW